MNEGSNFQLLKRKVMLINIKLKFIFTIEDLFIQKLKVYKYF